MTEGYPLNIMAEVEVGVNDRSSKANKFQIDSPTSIMKLKEPHLDHAYCSNTKNLSEHLLKKIELMKLNEIRLKNEVQNANDNINCLKCENTRLKYELKRVQDEMKGKEKEIKNTMFRFANVSRNQETLQFYTGFSSVEDFNVLYRQVESALPEASLYYKGKGNERSPRNQSSRGRPMALDFQDQLFLTLCKLRVGLLNRDLAFRFQISFTTVSNYFTTWLDFLYRKLTILPIWPSREVVDQHMPAEFREKFPTTRVIIDCTEFFIEKPSDYSTQCDTYSNYKRHTTAEGLLGITPNGFVSFVAPLAPGRESDTELTASSGLVDLLEKGDSCMADRGFLIHDLLAAKGVALNIPPFLGNRTQLSEVDEQRTREIASVRIHIERVIKELKTFRILKYTFLNTLHSSLKKSGLSAATF